MRYLKVLPWPNVERDTPEILFNKVLHLVQMHGHYDAAEKIMDYALPEDYDKRQFTRYEFDFIANVNKGGSEGIYIDCYLRGKFDDSGDKTCKVGTFKTLREDIYGYKVMGELSGLLVAYADLYVNQNIDRYASVEELENQAKYTNAPELYARFDSLFSYPAYQTSMGWGSFIGKSLSERSYNAFVERFTLLIAVFEAISKNYGKEIAEAIYHNIHNNPPAALQPENLERTAQYVKNGGNLDDLRWMQ